MCVGREEGEAERNYKMTGFLSIPSERQRCFTRSLGEGNCRTLCHPDPWPKHGLQGPPAAGLPPSQTHCLTLSFRSHRNLSLWARLCMKTPSRWPVSTERISMAFSPQPIIWLEQM